MTGNNYINRLLALDVAEAELAELLGYHLAIDTAKRWGLPVRRLGQFERVRRCELHAWAEVERTREVTF